MDKTSEYNITLKIRNNLLLQAFKDAGETPGQILAQKIGISYLTLNKYINLNLSPLDNDGDYRLSAYMICDFLNKLPKDLWTEEQLIPLNYSTVEITASYEQIATYLPSCDDATISLENEDLQREMTSMLAELEPRQRRVIELRFGLIGKEHTLKEVGEEFGLSPDAIRMIEAKALRKLRNPLIHKNLKDYINPEFYSLNASYE